MYLYLTDEDKARIVAEVQASRPDPEATVKAAEEAHFRSMVEAKLGLHEEPDPFVAPDVRAAEAEKAAIEAEAAKLPAVSARVVLDA